MASFCDYDRDGWLDVYIATNMLDNVAHPDGQRGYLFHNNRDGTFTNVTERAGIGRRVAEPFRDVVGLRQRRLARPLRRQRLRGPRQALPQQPGRHVHRYARQRAAPHLLLLDGLGPWRREQRRPHRLLRRGHGRHQPPGRTSTRSPTPAAGRWRPLGIQRLRPSTTATRSSSTPALAGSSRRRTSPESPPPTGPGRCASRTWTTTAASTSSSPTGSSGTRARTCNARIMNAETAAERIRIMQESPVLAETHLAFRNLGRPAVRGRKRRLGPRPEGRRLRRRLRRPQRGRQPRPRLFQLRGRRHHPAQRQRHGPRGERRPSRDASRTASAWEPRSGSRARSASRCASSRWPAATCRAASPCSTSAWAGTLRCGA